MKSEGPLELVKQNSQNMERLFLLALLLMCLTVSSGRRSRYGKWSYNHGKYGPGNWGNIRGGSSCLGSNQSPIDINTVETLETEFRPFRFTGYDSDGRSGNARPVQMSNNGKTVKITLEGDYLLRGGGLPSTYRAAQMHFHWGADWTKGSEHTINGQHYPAELHIVHYDTVKYANIGAALKQPDGLAVLGFWLKMGRYNNNWDTIINQLSSVRYVGTAFDYTQQPFALTSLLPNKRHLNKFYRYRGSLTTPGCYESVVWTVFNEPIELGETQIENFRTLTSLRAPPSQVRARFGGGGADREADLILDNFRPVQHLNYRNVYQSFEHQEASEYESPEYESPESEYESPEYPGWGTGGTGAGTGNGGTGGTGTGTAAQTGAGAGTGTAGTGNGAAGTGWAGDYNPSYGSDLYFGTVGGGQGAAGTSGGYSNGFAGQQGGQPDMTGQTNYYGNGQGGQVNSGTDMTGQTNYYDQGGNSGLDMTGQTNYYGNGQVNSGPDMTGQTNYYGQDLGGYSGGQTDYYGQGGQVNSGPDVTGQTNYYGNPSSGQVDINQNENKPAGQGIGQGGGNGGHQATDGQWGQGAGDPWADYGGYGTGNAYGSPGEYGGVDYGTYGGNGNSAGAGAYDPYDPYADVSAFPQEPSGPQVGGSQPGMGGTNGAFGGTGGVGVDVGVGVGAGGTGQSSLNPQFVNTDPYGGAEEPVQSPDPYKAGHQELAGLAQMWRQLVNGQKSNPDDAAYYDGGDFDVNANAKAEMNAYDQQPVDVVDTNEYNDYGNAMEYNANGLYNGIDNPYFN